MGYEIWDRDERTLVADFDDRAAALHFLRDMVKDMTVESATHRVDSLQLVQVSDEGGTQTVLAEGVGLLGVMFSAVISR